MTHSTLWLAQVQFFTSLGFMLLFLVLELGLAWVLLYFKLRALTTRDAVWTTAYRFWIRVFALAFVLSFASSLPVLIQFGSLWPGLMGKMGDIAGPLLAAGMLCAYVFKSCFLGAMLFGQRRFSVPVYTAVVAMVAVGVSLTTFFLLVLVSWMHAPEGAALINGQYRINDAWRVIFNPALPWYSMLFAALSFLTVGFLMVGTVAVQSLRHPTDVGDRMVFRTGLYLAAASLIVLAGASTGTGRMVAQHQPAKAAATAAYWHSGAPPQLVLFALPDTDQAANHRSWSWRGAGGFWLGRDDAGQLKGLDQFAGMHPPVRLTFWTMRLALAIGALMAIVAALSLWKLRSTHGDPDALSRRWRRGLAVFAFSGWALLLPGLAWLLFGSFPYAVSGTITISEVVAAVDFNTLLGGYIVYLALYGSLLFGFFQLLGHVVRYGVVPVARRRGRA